MFALPGNLQRWLGVGLMAALAGVLSGCAAILGAPPPPVMPSQALVIPPSPEASRDGSLWRPTLGDNYLFTDDRARFPGDLLTVLVLESDSGSREASTGSENSSSVEASLEQFFGLPQQLQLKNPDINPSQLVRAASKRTWDGEGATARKGNLTASVTVEVKAISPSGNLWVQGDKVVSVNREDQHLVLAGWVRPQDINSRNEVESTRLGDARIAYYGRGPVGRQQKQPWGIAIMDWIWPF